MLASDLKTGVVFKSEGIPFQVLKYNHIKMARGGATVRVKVRNLLTEAVTEKTYNSPDKIEDADVTRSNAQYLYNDGDTYYFMDPATFNQINIAGALLGDSADFLLEGNTVQVVYFEGNPISVELPANVVLQVTYTEPGIKGNSVTNVYKDAVLADKVTVKVPLFIKIGDVVRVDTRTREYVSKA